MDDSRQFIKDVAMCFYIKCSKYRKDQLTTEIVDALYNEALNETSTMYMISNK